MVIHQHSRRLWLIAFSTEQSPLCHREFGFSDWAELWYQTQRMVAANMKSSPRGFLLHIENPVCSLCTPAFVLVCKTFRIRASWHDGAFPSSAFPSHISFISWNIHKILDTVNLSLDSFSNIAKKKATFFRLPFVPAAIAAVHSEQAR